MIVVKVRDRDIKAAPMGPVTTGSVGLPVRWEFSEEWTGLAKTAVFRGSNTARDVFLTEDVCTVPAEVLTAGDGPLEIGVRGVQITHDEDTDEDVLTVVIPTIWGRIERIYDGTIPSQVDPSVQEPDWTDQVKAAAAEALSKATAAAPFYAEFGVTTKAEIETAINDKRQIYAYQSLSPYPPILPYVGKISYSDEQGSGVGYRFSLIEGTTQTVYELMSTWVYRTNDLTEPAQRAEAAAAHAEEVLDSIPADYTELSEDVSDLQSAVGSNTFALDEHILKPIKHATLSSDLAVTFSSPESQLYTDYVSGLIPLPETLDGKITHNGNGYSSSRAIVFYNSAKAPIGSETQNGYNLIETTIPDGSAFFRLRRGGGSASLQASFNLSASAKSNYLRALMHVEPDLYIYDFDAPNIFSLEHTEISTSTGEDTYSSSSNYSATDFILLPDDIELIGTYAYTASGRARVAFYDAAKTFISAVYSASKRLAATSIPDGAVFVRFGTHSTIPPASCIAVGLVKATISNDEIIDIIRQALV